MTIDERLEALEKELARAKRRNRRLLAVVALAVGAFALVWVFAAAASRTQAQGSGVPAVIRASKFEVVDGNGKTRAYLEATKDGPTLFLFGETASARLSVQEKDGSTLSLFDRSGKGGLGHAVLSAGKGHAVGKGHSALVLSGGNGKTRATLGASEDGTALSLDRGTGVCSVRLSTHKGLPPGGGVPLAVYDENGKGRAVLTLIKNRLMLVLHDENGEPVWSAP